MNEPLLYDPLFENPPDTVIRDGISIVGPYVVVFCRVGGWLILKYLHVISSRFFHSIFLKPVLNTMKNKYCILSGIEVVDKFMRITVFHEYSPPENIFESVCA